MHALAKLRSTPFENSVWLFCFALPIWPRLAAWIAALILLIWAFQSSRSRPWARLAKPVSLLLPLLFLWYLAGLAYTANQPAGWQNVETKLSLLIFPLVLLSAPAEKLRPWQWIRAFVAGCLAVVLISLSSAVWVYLTRGESFFFYEKLSSFLGLHPTYFAMYLGLALFGVVSDKDMPLRLKIALASFFLLFFFLLSARMQLLLLAALTLGALWIWAAKLGAIRTATFATLGSMVLFSGLLILLPGTRHRFQRLLHPTDNVRMETWNASIDLLRQHPLLGTGTGDFNGALIEVYQEKGFYTALKDKLNAHNQYLQTAATLGFPASLLLVIGLAWPLALAWKEKDPLFAWFLLLFALSNLTESMLETQRGTIFYGFFNSLFLAGILNRKMSAFFSGVD